MQRTPYYYKLICMLLCVLTAVACTPGLPSGQPSAPAPEFGTASEPVAFEEFPRMDGSTANLPLMRALAMYYTGISAEEAELAISVSTTDYAYHALEFGYCDLLLVYEASPETKQWIKDMGSDFEMKPIGRDALVFICNESNPVSDLSTGQIQDIYSGAVTSWQEVGGEDVAIVPYQRTVLSGSQTMMEKLVMKEIPMMDAPTELRPAAMAGLVDQIVEYQNTGNALGYSVYYYVRNMYALPGVKTLSVDGVAPSNQSIKDGSYPFVNDFFAVIRTGEPQDSMTRQVYDFLTTDKGKQLIEQAGYVAG